MTNVQDEQRPAGEGIAETPYTLTAPPRTAPTGLVDPAGEPVSSDATTVLTARGCAVKLQRMMGYAKRRDREALIETVHVLAGLEMKCQEAMLQCQEAMQVAVDLNRELQALKRGDAIIHPAEFPDADDISDAPETEPAPQTDATLEDEAREQYAADLAEDTAGNDTAAPRADVLTFRRSDADAG